MKRTLTAFTAAIFAGALAIPAFAQVGISGDANIDTPASSMSSSSSSESTHHEYRAVEPAPMTNSVERTEREYRSERNDEIAAPVPPPEEIHHHVEHKVTTRTTDAAVPPPMVEQRTTTTRRTETERGDNTRRSHGVGANVGANVGPLGAHVGAGVGSTDSGY
jgi:hypothetical protein